MMKRVNETRRNGWLVAFAFVGAAALAPFSGSALAGHNDEDRQTCHATGQLSSGLLLPPIATRELDVDGNGDAEFSIINQLITAGWTGDIEGRGAALQVVLNNIDDQITSITALANLAVSVCDSKPGSMAVIFSIINDNSVAPPKSEVRMTVIEGTGTLGLEGICGGGVIEAGFFDFTFRFADACNASARSDGHRRS
jgi:hypothetical protein